MNFHVLTLFPEMIEQGVNTSITGRAINNGLLSINAVNIRDYAFNKHNSVDDYPYGGGAGMLMQAEPVYLAYEAVKEQIDKRKQENIKSEEVTSTEPADCSEVRNSDLQDQNSKKRPLRVVYLSPQGDVFNQKMAEEMAISRSNLQRKLKGLTGMPPNDYIRLIRLKTAGELLREGEYRINEVCFIVGFNNPSYFARCFQKQFGILPKDYVKGGDITHSQKGTTSISP